MHATLNVFPSQIRVSYVPEFGIQEREKIIIFLQRCFWEVSEMLPIEVMLLSLLIASMLGCNNWYQDACVHAKSLQSCPTLQPHETGRLLCVWDSPGKNIGVGLHALLQRIPTQGSNLHLLCLLHPLVDSLTPVPPGKPWYPEGSMIICGYSQGFYLAQCQSILNTQLVTEELWLEIKVWCTGVTRKLGKDSCADLTRWQQQDIGRYPWRRKILSR